MTLFRLAVVAALSVCTGCGSQTVCEKAADLWAECADVTQTTPTTTTSTGTAACAVGSVAECNSICTVDAYDNAGCDALTGTDPDWLGCVADCSNLSTGDTDTGM